MAELLTSSKLQGEEADVVRVLSRRLASKRRRHKELEATYRGRQLIQVLGIAVPPDLRGLETILNWNRVFVDTLEHRMDVKALMLPGEQEENQALREGWDVNNMELQASLNHRETMVQGHNFVTVSTNEADREHPLITVETARNMIAHVDPRTRTMRSCLRLYSDPWRKQWAPDQGTLYLPDSTVWLQRDQAFGPWRVVDRDDHRLGRVPVIMFLNNQRAGDWMGESEMADLMPITEMAARVLMDLHLAMETLAVPKRYVINATQGQFTGPDGQLREEWDAYYDAMWALTGLKPGQEPKVGQLPGADLGGFISTITMLAQQASAISGLPMRYFGQNPANPAAEGAIKADESRMVKNVERKNRAFGVAWGWVMALYERFRTGEWVDGNRVAVEWYDPNTPTFAQRADAIQKLAGGVPILSREGAWDELGWSPERKDRERGYFASEAAELQLSYEPMPTELDPGDDGEPNR